MPMYKISIIIPIYNASVFLKRCIDSVLKQTYQNFELILVNDGSNDDSGEICQHYAEKNSNIKYISKNNGGVSSARNIGFEHSCGDFICFIDADDWLEPNYIEKLAEKIGGNNNIDMVECSLIEEGAEIIKNKIWGRNIDAQEYRNKVLFISDDGAYHGYIHTKMFKSAIIKKNRLTFREDLHYNEDRVFIAQYTLYAKSIACIDDSLYHYYINPDGAMTNIKTSKFNPRQLSELKSYEILIADNLIPQEEKKKYARIGNIKAIELYCKAKNENEIKQQIDDFVNLFQIYDKNIGQIIRFISRNHTLLEISIATINCLNKMRKFIKRL
jgi:glycosyltransferase involved in cell wall biosynthesis